MAQPIRIVHHRNGTVQRIFRTWIETDIPGLNTLYAIPRADQHATARDLGYGSDIDALTRDHDFLHAWLADKMDLPVSLALSMAAKGEVGCCSAALEEAAVLAIQRYAKAAGVDVGALA